MIERTEKKCNQCEKIKPIDEFNKQHTSADGHRNRCRECTNKYHHDYFQAHREEIRLRKRTKKSSQKSEKKQPPSRKKRTPEENIRRNNMQVIWNLKKAYNGKIQVTIEEYEQLITLQNGKCAICGNSEIIAGRRLSLDHDHETGKIRELLCYSCNAGIGFLRDDPTILEKAISYILKHKSK